MAGFVDAKEQAILDLIFNAALGATTLYIGLSTTTPTEAAGNITEPVGNNYSRVATTSADWNAASGTAPATKTNSGTKTFNQASGSWGTITHFGHYDASTLGNVILWGALTASKAIGNGDTASFPASSITLQLGDPADSY